MSWTTPVTRSPGYKVLDTDWNAVQNNLAELRQGGVALASQAQYDLMYASSATQWQRLATGTGVLAASGAAPAWTASPTLTAPVITQIELGHASDTTLTRSSAGVLAVEGTAIPKGTGTANYVAYWTDTNVLSAEAQLAVSRGGTGAGSFTAGRLLIGAGTSAVSTDAGLSWDGSLNVAKTDGSNIANWTASTATNSSYHRFVNNETAYVGLDNSTGSDLGGKAYALNLYVTGAHSIVMSTNGTLRCEIDSSGNLFHRASNVRGSVIATTGTNAAYYLWQNTSGGAYFGVENSAGSEFGATAYGVVVYGADINIITPTATPILFKTNNATALTLGATQIATFASDAVFAATKKIYLDGGSDTYIYESAADTITFVAGGTTGFSFTSNVITVVNPSNAGLAALTVSSISSGSGAAVVGMHVNHNSSGSVPAAGCWSADTNAGTRYYWWVDASGNARIGLLEPSFGNDTHASSTVIGTQTSLRKLKTIFGEHTDYAASLRKVVDLRLWEYEYANGAFPGDRFTGITLGPDVDLNAPDEFSMDHGKALNYPTMFGHAFGAIKALKSEQDVLREELEALRRRAAAIEERLAA